MNLEKEETRQAKRVRNTIGRWQVKRKIFRRCELDGQFFLKEKLDCNEDSIYKKRGIGYFVQSLAREALFNKHQQKLERMIQEAMDYAKMIHIDPSDMVARYAEKMKETDIN